jgi:hypothetical protein
MVKPSQSGRTITDSEIQACVLRQLVQRAASSSICPSDVARSLVEDERGWRGLMSQVRQVAARMAHQGSIVITQGSVTLDPDREIQGPIRLRRGPKFPDPK